jgi:hypothetical protein
MVEDGEADLFGFRQKMVKGLDYEDRAEGRVFSGGDLRGRVVPVSAIKGLDCLGADGSREDGCQSQGGKVVHDQSNRTWLQVVT